MDPDPAGVEVRSPDRHMSSLFFVRVDNAKLTKNRLHLDLYAEDQAAAVDDLIARGATHATVGQPDTKDPRWCVLGIRDVSVAGQHPRIVIMRPTV